MLFHKIQSVVAPRMNSENDIDALGQDDELLLPEIRRTGVPQPILWEMVRELEESDLPALISVTSEVSQPPAQPLSKVRAAHHSLAQLIVEGKSNIEIGFLSGYSPTYISMLRSDPTFKELVAHYSQNRDKVYVDVLERMKIAGLNSLEELQDRLTNEPEKFANSQLLELVNKLLVAPAAAALGARGNGNAPSISIQFVQPQGAVMQDAGLIIDGKPRAME